LFNTSSIIKGGVSLMSAIDAIIGGFHARVSYAVEGTGSTTGVFPGGVGIWLPVVTSVDQRDMPGVRQIWALGRRDITRKPKGAITSDIGIRWHPEINTANDINLLKLAFNDFTLDPVFNNENSLSLEVSYSGSNIPTNFLYSGSRAERVRLEGRVEQPLDVRIDYWAEGSTARTGSLGFINSYFTSYTPATDPGLDPIMFFDNSVTFTGSGISDPGILSPIRFRVDLRNDLRRLWAFNTRSARAIIPQKRDIRCEFEMVFESINHYNRMFNDSIFDTQINLGNNTLFLYQCKWVEIEEPAKAAELVIFPARLIASSGSII
jgi:hypothetical protein